jgi:hypothetical protein
VTLSVWAMHSASERNRVLALIEIENLFCVSS